jgi:hypothetical protein
MFIIFKYVYSKNSSLLFVERVKVEHEPLFKKLADF